MATKKRSQREPTEAEIAELKRHHVVEMTGLLESAKIVAARVFGQNPSPAVVLGVFSRDLSDEDELADLIAAQGIAAKVFGGAVAPETVFAVYDEIFDFGDDDEDGTDD